MTGFSLENYMNPVEMNQLGKQYAHLCVPIGLAVTVDTVVPDKFDVLDKAVNDDVFDTMFDKIEYTPASRKNKTVRVKTIRTKSRTRKA
tara:strand:- start:339 stop:605 length:267 start_codon:yes stop_codon:yes gene_type:complete